LIQEGTFDVDAIYMNHVLQWTFDHIAADPARTSISGFSDGATYAIWLGLKNGDLFTRIAAFTPCTLLPTIRTGMPTVFVSHGTDDTLRPIDQCSRVMVPSLQADGYTVQYIEYPSATTPPGTGHFITPDVITQGMTYLAHQ
jgi:phospholipase/carboxylesterase